MTNNLPADENYDIFRKTNYMNLHQVKHEGDEESRWCSGTGDPIRAHPVFRYLLFQKCLLIRLYKRTDEYIRDSIYESKLRLSIWGKVVQHSENYNLYCMFTIIFQQSTEKFSLTMALINLSSINLESLSYFDLKP